MLGEQDEMIWFYLWRRIVAMRLAREEDLATPSGYPSPQSSAG